MKKQICKNCNFYTSYYRQFSSNYIKSENGYCSRHSKILIRLDSCPDYRSNEEKELRREELRLRDLDRALISINEIAQILKEKSKLD